MSRSRFILEIDTENGAFKDPFQATPSPSDRDYTRAEVSRLLHLAATRIVGTGHDDDTGPLLDVNGATVGEWKFEPGE